MDSSHSPSSSLADADYYVYSYSHSPSSSLASASALQPPATTATTASYSGYTAQAQPQPIERKQAQLAHISIPSFSAFRSRASNIPVSSPAAPRKLPTNQTALKSPRHASFSVAEKASPRLADPDWRPLSLGSPVPEKSSGLTHELSPPLTGEPPEKQSEISAYVFPRPPSHARHASIDPTSTNHPPPSTSPRRSSIPVHARYAHDPQPSSHAPKQSISSLGSYSHYGGSVNRASVVSMSGGQLEPEDRRAQQPDGIRRTLTNESRSHSDSRQQSPAGRIGNLFGWKSSSPHKAGTDSSTTSFSDRSPSPLHTPHDERPSPMASSKNGGGQELRPIGLDIQKANANTVGYFDNTQTPILIGTPQSGAHVKELERELSQVSSELAESIKREMELEDEVERMREEMPSLRLSEGAERRSSDYFSDSGTSSSRYPVANVDVRIEELEKLLRKAEQEKGQIKMDTAARLQTELSRRRDLEIMVANLEEQVNQQTAEDAQRANVEARSRELQSTLDDTRRLLSQEQSAKASFEDLYSATRMELERYKNEHDNLRDEVVPQMKARVQGLELEAADTQALMYENTRIQHELAALKERSSGRVGMIAEEDDAIASPVSGGPKMGLSRSASLARTGSAMRGSSLSRSNSVKDRDAGRHRSGSGTGPLSAEGVKEIEDQRDALHKALKLLLSRHDKQQRDHGRAIRKLVRPTPSSHPADPTTTKRTAYQKEVALLKDDLFTLRKRAEDALDRKFQYEKGLSGLKIDLDRAEQETRDLRALLRDHDILAPSSRLSQNPTDASPDDDAEGTHDLSLAAAESDRDRALAAAESYSARASAAAPPDDATALKASAHRMHQLASSLSTHITATASLRDRLAAAVATGEAEQQRSGTRIAQMQQRLAGLEESVLQAQGSSEAVLARVEGEVRELGDAAASPALDRLGGKGELGAGWGDMRGARGGVAVAPKSPLARPPAFAPSTPTLASTSLLERSKASLLERKVRELEGLLKEAEADMQAVVARVNRSQVEVAALREEREESVRVGKGLVGGVEEV